MSDFFDDVQEADNIVEDGDRLGGFQVLSSGVYQMNIDQAYQETSKGGAKGVAVTFKSDSGQYYRETFWVVGKNGKTYWQDKDAKKHNIPGFNHAKHLCLLTTGTDLTGLKDTVETKIIKKYDSASGEMVETKVPMIMGLLGKNINIAILSVTVDKNVENDAGEWVPSGEVRETNEIEKFFDAETNRTYEEIRMKKAEASFINEWSLKWTGQVKNKAKGAKPGTKPGAAAGAAQPATKSLFV